KQTLKVGQRVLVPVAFGANGIGISNVALNLKGPGGFSVVHSWQIQSRAPQLDIARDEIQPFAANESYTANHGLVADIYLDRQNYAGNFGRWAPGSDAEPWISVFALDFLYQAKQKGYVVANDALKRGASWLKQTAASDSADDNTRAYAFYVLARMGQVNIS